MRTKRFITATALAASLVLTSCSSADEEPSTDAPVDETSQATPSTESQPSESASSEETPSEEPTTEPTTEDDEPISEAALLSVSIQGEEILPNAQEIQVDAGEVVLVEVASDRAGELHVHSKPEQFLAFEEGTTNAELVIDTPGTVEIEDHDTSAVVAIVEVR